MLVNLTAAPTGCTQLNAGRQTEDECCIIKLARCLLSHSTETGDALRPDGRLRPQDISSADVCRFPLSPLANHWTGERGGGDGGDGFGGQQLTVGRSKMIVLALIWHLLIRDGGGARVYSVDFDLVMARQWMME